MSHNLEKLIFGGVKEKLGMAPWHVAIYKQSKVGKTLICGGTIVSEYAILSGRRVFIRFKINQKFVILMPL